MPKHTGATLIIHRLLRFTQGRFYIIKPERARSFMFRLHMIQYMPMHNWDYPKDQNVPVEEKWRLERLLQYGIGDEKIDRAVLERNFSNLNIPEHTKAFLELLLWNKAF